MEFKMSRYAIITDIVDNNFVFIRENEINSIYQCNVCEEFVTIPKQSDKPENCFTCYENNINKSELILYRINFKNNTFCYTEMTLNQRINFPLRNVKSIGGMKYYSLPKNNVLIPYEIAEKKAKNINYGLK